MKPPRGKRVDPQSRPAGFSSARVSGLVRFGIPGTRPCRRTGTRRVHFPRAERHDRLRAGHKPVGKVGERFGARCYSPSRWTGPGPRNDRRLKATLSSRRVRLAGTGQPCLPTARRVRWGVPGRPWVCGESVGLPPDPS